jgi:hypothetical protein
MARIEEGTIKAMLQALEHMSDSMAERAAVFWRGGGIWGVDSFSSPIG